MTKNVFLIGTVAGIIGNLAKEIMAWIFYLLGLVEYAFCHFCAGVFISPHQLREPLSVLIGMFMDYTVASFFGLICYYIYLMTGGGYHLLRGFGFGGLMFLVCYGVLSSLFSVVVHEPPLTVFFYLIPNLLYGLTMMAFIRWYAPYFQEL